MAKGPFIIVIMSSMDVAVKEMTTAACSKLFSETIPLKRPIIKLPVIMAIPLIPNNILNV